MPWHFVCKLNARSAFPFMIFVRSIAPSGRAVWPQESSHYPWAIPMRGGGSSRFSYIFVNANSCFWAIYLTVGCNAWNPFRTNLIRAVTA